MERACLSRFLPRLPQEALFKAMKQCGLEKPDAPSETNSICSVEEGYLTIGQTRTRTYQHGNQAKVPDVVFYDTDQVRFYFTVISIDCNVVIETFFIFIWQHLRVLESLLQDFLLGDHLLLVGNQGVGKNRVIDRLLALMNRPREYIQLHRFDH